MDQRNAKFNIGQVVIRYVKTQQPEGFDERVAAACQLAANVQGTQGLCEVFNTGDLPAWAHNQIGRVILGLTGQGPVPNGNIDKDKKDKHEDNRDKEKNGNNGRPQISNAPAPKPIQIDINIRTSGNNPVNVNVDSKGAAATNVSVNKSNGVTKFFEQIKTVSDKKDKNHR